MTKGSLGKRSCRECLPDVWHELDRRRLTLGIGGFVVLVIIAAVVAVYLEKEGRATLQEAARVCEATPIKTGFFGEASLNYRLDGEFARINFEDAQRHQPGTTRFRYRLRSRQTLRLTPADMFTSIKKLFGSQDIRIGDRAFDKAFHVQGRDDAWVRETLRGDLRRLCERLGRLDGSFSGSPGVRFDLTGMGLTIEIQSNLISEHTKLRRAKTLCDLAFHEIKRALAPGLKVSVQISGDDKDCSICMDGLSGLEHRCRHCRTSYHAECWEGLGGCAVFGCKGMYQRRERKRGKE